MKYVVKKGHSYTDTKGRNKVYGPGEIFEGELDSVQRWKVGRIDQAVDAGNTLPFSTKGMHDATQTKKAETETEEVDPMDEGEETE